MGDDEAVPTVARRTGGPLSMAFTLEVLTMQIQTEVTGGHLTPERFALGLWDPSLRGAVSTVALSTEAAQSWGKAPQL